MSYSSFSLKRLMDLAPTRFKPEGELRNNLESFEAVALRRCGIEMRSGLYSTIDRFGEQYSCVPDNASLKTPSIRRGVDMPLLLDRDPKQVWTYLDEENEPEALLEIAANFEHKVKCLLNGVIDFNFRPGPIKERQKIVEEMMWRWPKRSDVYGGEVAENDQRVCMIRDIIRGRIEAGCLRDVELAMERLLGQEADLEIAACFNTYQQLFPSRRDFALPRPYLACNFTFIAGDKMPYELQIMTKQAALVGKLTHPGFLLQKDVPQKLQEDAETLAWAGHIMDYEEYLCL